MSELQKIDRPKRAKKGQINFVIASVDENGCYIEYAASTSLNIVPEVMKVVGDSFAEVKESND